MSENPMRGRGRAARASKSTRWRIRVAPKPPRRHQMASMAEMVASADAMTRLSQVLRELTSRFRTGGEGPS